jgi:hypothetical protein
MMYAGNIVAPAAAPIPPEDLAELYYADLHGAYDAMCGAFEKRQIEGINQDYIAARLDVDKALVSKRLNGRKNLTLRVLSYMASALNCKLTIQFVPYEEMRASNYFFGCMAPAPAQPRNASGGFRIGSANV